MTLHPKVKHVHFVGVGGISMSGLAAYLLARGYRVSGSDLKDSPLVRRLVDQGLAFYRGHAAEHVNGADLVVYTAAVKESNPELAAARRAGIPVMTRAELIGTLMEQARFGVAVAGTHGKTTTTALIALALVRAGLDPTALVGGEVEPLGGNVRLGSGNVLVTEACEYSETFLRFKPYLGVILNIDDDHLDYFHSMDNVVRAFHRFACLVPPEGALVANADDPRVREVIGAGDVRAEVITYGLAGGARWRARDVRYVEHAPYPEFTLEVDGAQAGRVRLSLPGRHHVSNALAALAACSRLGVSGPAALEAVSEFRGVRRRFELVGSVNGAPVYDDYAHHPAAIRVTLEAARRFNPDRLWCVFQPHLFSRTKALLDKFAEELAAADLVVLPDIYPSREEDPGDISSADLAREINARAPSTARHVPALDDVVTLLRREVRPGDLVLTVGAGDVDRVARELTLAPAPGRP